MNTPKDFPEDYTRQNGCYSHLCPYCRTVFYGHKRKVVCKECKLVEDSAKFKFKTNDVVRYIGESTTSSLDTAKLYVVNSSEMYGGALYVYSMCSENFLIDSKPEMFTLVYRENK